jgi:hypothetical protein
MGCPGITARLPSLTGRGRGGWGQQVPTPEPAASIHPQPLLAKEGRRKRNIVVFAELLLAPAAIGQSCGTKTYCREMTSCADALYHLKECGLTRLDGDGDGSPCESLCGDGGNRKNRKSARKTSVAEPPTADGETDFTCSGKRTCRQMSNCAEAIFYLQNCGVKQLDGNNDGVPCNALCR